MKAVILKVDPIKPESSDIEQAVRLLKSGEFVAFPTDTVYGIGADAFNKHAVEQIFHAKKRPHDKPLQVLISHNTNLDSITKSNSVILRNLATKFWPGPLTIVVSARENFPKWVTCGLDTVGIRMPASKIALDIIETFGGPLAATSANISGHPDPVSVQEVTEYLGNEVPLIIDGGNTPGNIPSTVLDISVYPPVILRQGKLPIEEIRKMGL